MIDMVVGMDIEIWSQYQVLHNKNISAKGVVAKRSLCILAVIHRLQMARGA